MGGKLLDDFTNVEHVTIYKNKVQLITIPGAELKGTNKTDLQIRLGKDFGPGIYVVSIKYKGIYKQKNTRITAINFEKNNETIEKLNNNNDEKFTALETKINSIANHSSGMGVSDLLNIYRESFNVQLEALRERIREQKEIIEQQQEEIENLINELDEIDSNLNKEEKGNNEITQLMETAIKFKNMFSGNIKSANNLKDIPSNSKLVPNQFIEALGKVNWNNVSEKEKEYYVNVFNQFADKLPLNENEVV